MRHFLTLFFVLNSFVIFPQQGGVYFGGVILKPINEISNFMDYSEGGMFGFEYKIDKIRTTFTTGLAFARYAKVSEKLENYYLPNVGAFDELEIYVLSRISQSLIGICIEPIKGNPLINPFVVFGLGRSAYRSSWNAIERQGRFDYGYSDTHSLSLSKTNNIIYGGGVRIGIWREENDGRMDIVFKVTRHLGTNVEFLNPLSNPDHFKIVYRNVDRQNKFISRSDYICFWIGLSIRVDFRELTETTY